MTDREIIQSLREQVNNLHAHQAALQSQITRLMTDAALLRHDRARQEDYITELEESLRVARKAARWEVTA